MSNPPTAIRQARPGEAPALHDLVAAAYGPYIAVLGRAPGPMLDDYAARIDRGEAFVLDDDGIIGLVVIEADTDALLLDNVAVSPGAQGRGFGRMLVAFAEAEARRRGFVRLRLYTHVLMTANQALYRRLGFAETGRGRQDGFDRVFMEKPVG